MNSERKSFFDLYVDRFWEKRRRPISRVLSRTIIHLAAQSPTRSSNLPESSASHADGFLFGLAPDGVYPAIDCYQRRGALLPHHFTLTRRRYIFCGTFRGLAPPRRYLASCSVEPGLSSRLTASDCPVVFGADDPLVVRFIQALQAFK